MSGQFEQRVTNLIDEIAETALDDDYYEVRAGRYSRSRSYSTWRTALVLGAFALVVTIAAVQTAGDRSVAQAQRSILAATLQDRETELTEARRELRALQEEIVSLQETADRRSGEHRRQALAGMLAVEGPGISIVLEHGEDSVGVLDVRSAVNGLWAAGAEAVAVNGQRLTSMSAIRNVGEAVIVNYRSISAPYVISAIGAPDELAEAFSDGQAGVHLRARQERHGIGLSVRSFPRLTLPAASANHATLEYARKGEAS